MALILPQQSLPVAPPCRALSSYGCSALSRPAFFGTATSRFQGNAHGAALRRNRAVLTRAEGALKEGELVSSEEEFLRKVTRHQGPVVVDWMAKWCRKCIYLKPKLEKFLQTEFPGLDLVFIDVNSIPGDLVYGHGIRKMPTITIHKNGEKVREHVAAEVGLKAITNIRTMITDYLELNPEEKEIAMKK